MKEMYLKACTRLHNRLLNHKGMEMLQVVLIVVLAIGLTGLLYKAISGWIGDGTTKGGIFTIFGKIEGAAK